MHPFLVGTQAHPELKSRPTRPHPLFVAFIGAALDYKNAERLPVEMPEMPAIPDNQPNGAAHALRRRPGPWLKRTPATLSGITSSPSPRPKPSIVGSIFALRADEVRMPGGGTARREIVEHYGAVAVVAIDDDGNIVLVYQYRHPFGRRLWELPAGLLDEGGEAPHVTAARELAEEAGLAAENWRVLVDLDSSPGFSDESVRVYLATGLRDVDRPEAARRGSRPDGATVRPSTTPSPGCYSGEIVNSICGRRYPGRPRDAGRRRRCAPSTRPGPTGRPRSPRRQGHP